jgi:hypothetical protein
MLSLPQSPDELVERLRFLHDERKRFPRPPRRLSVTPEQRSNVLDKTDSRCHLCGSEITERSLQRIMFFPTQLEENTNLPTISQLIGIVTGGGQIFVRTYSQQVYDVRIVLLLLPSSAEGFIKLDHG